jgi:hypothetical protein
MNRRRLTVTALTLAAMGVSACSSSGLSATNNTTTATGAASTTAESTTTTAAPVVVTEATAAPTSPPPSTAPPTTHPTTTTQPKLTLYQEVNPPKVPTTHTDPFLSSGTLGNGTYWVMYSGGETQTPNITVVQAFFGAECQSMATANTDECVDDIYVLGDPSRDISDLAFAPNVFLTLADSNTQKSYWITPDELRRVRASSPSHGAPDNFSFSSFPFLMTVKSGKITRFEQVWTP